MRVNKVIQLLEEGQPVYYASTDNLTYENGRDMAGTWADYIRLDLEHGVFDIKGVDEFMRGLVDGGPTPSGHRTPAVVAELPMDGIDGQTVASNSWMIKQLLARGVHGLILCQVESASAARAMVEFTRYSFQSLGVGPFLSQGRRGHGGQKKAAKIWGVSDTDYLKKADVWPLNPEGELILGVKMENIRSVDNAEDIAKTPGLAYGEWGLGDMAMSCGYIEKPPFPLPERLEKIRTTIWNACKKADLHFLGIVTPDTIKGLIDRGMTFCRAYEKETAEIGWKYTNRKMP